MIGIERDILTPNREYRPGQSVVWRSHARLLIKGTVKKLVSTDQVLVAWPTADRLMDVTEILPADSVFGEGSGLNFPSEMREACDGSQSEEEAVCDFGEELEPEDGERREATPLKDGINKAKKWFSYPKNTQSQEEIETALRGEGVDDPWAGYDDDAWDEEYQAYVGHLRNRYYAILADQQGKRYRPAKEDRIYTHEALELAAPAASAAAAASKKPTPSKEDDLDELELIDFDEDLPPKLYPPVKPEPAPSKPATPEPATPKPATPKSATPKSATPKSAPKKPDSAEDETSEAEAAGFRSDYGVKIPAWQPGTYTGTSTKKPNATYADGTRSKGYFPQHLVDESRANKAAKQKAQNTAQMDKFYGESSGTPISTAPKKANRFVSDDDNDKPLVPPAPKPPAKKKPGTSYSDPNAGNPRKRKASRFAGEPLKN